jgi:hypothetical protein
MRTSVLTALTVLVIGAVTVVAFAAPITAASPPESARVMYPGFENLRLGMDVDTATRLVRKVKGVSGEQQIFDPDGTACYYNFAGVFHSKVVLYFTKGTGLLKDVTFDTLLADKDNRSPDFKRFRSYLEKYFEEELSFEDMSQDNNPYYRCSYGDTVIKSLQKYNVVKYQISKRLLDQLGGGRD